MSESTNMLRKAYDHALDMSDAIMSELREWLAADPARSMMAIIQRDGMWRVALWDGGLDVASGYAHKYGEAVNNAVEGLAS